MPVLLLLPLAAPARGSMMEHFYHNEIAKQPSNCYEDAIDYPCAPCWVHGYARQGLTQDYPQEFYWPNISALEEKIQELENEIDELKGKRILYKYIQPIKPTPKWKGFNIQK